MYQKIVESTISNFESKPYYSHLLSVFLTSQCGKRWQILTVSSIFKSVTFRSCVPCIGNLLWNFLPNRKTMLRKTVPNFPKLKWWHCSYSIAWKLHLYWGYKETGPYSMTLGNGFILRFVPVKLMTTVVLIFKGPLWRQIKAMHVKFLMYFWSMLSAQYMVPWILLSISFLLVHEVYDYRPNI